MFGLKKEKGYTPWVAKKAPATLTTINALYIRSNIVLIGAVTSMVIGVLVGNQVLPKFDKQSNKHTLLKTAAVNIPVKKTINNPPQSQPQPQMVIKENNERLIMQSEMTVPAIPMGSAPILLDQISVFLINQFKLNDESAQLITKSSMESAKEYGLDRNYLIALSIHTGKLAVDPKTNKVKVFNTNLAKHPHVEAKLKSAGTDIESIPGQYKLLSEVLVEHYNTNNQDINQATLSLLREVGIKQTDINTIMNTKQFLDNITK